VVEPNGLLTQGRVTTDFTDDTDGGGGISLRRIPSANLKNGELGDNLDMLFSSVVSVASFPIGVSREVMSFV